MQTAGDAITWDLPDTLAVVLGISVAVHSSRAFVEAISGYIAKLQAVCRDRLEMPAVAFDGGAEASLCQAAGEATRGDQMGAPTIMFDSSDVVSCRQAAVDTTSGDISDKQVLAPAACRVALHWWAVVRRRDRLDGGDSSVGIGGNSRQRME